jgi:transposase
LTRPSYDTEKKVKGKKRHILVDAHGLLMHAIVHPADNQDRDGSGFVLPMLIGMKALPHPRTEMRKAIRRDQGGEVLPRRWVVERTFVCSTDAPASPKIGKISIAVRSFPTPRFHRAHATKALQSIMMIFGPTLSSSEFVDRSTVWRL